MKAPLPPNENQRLAALHAAGLLDTPAEEAFEDFVRLAAHICGVPMSAVSLVDKDRQWFKASLGLSVCETSRDAAFCAYTILDPTQMLIVPDARLDPRFADNPLVTGAPHIRFYAGAPLAMPTGQVLGSLCVIDVVPRQLDQAQINALEMLARQLMRELESRRVWVDLAEYKLALDHHAIVVVADINGRLTHVNDRFCNVSRYERDDLITSKAVTAANHPVHAFFAEAWATISLGLIWRGEVQGRTLSGEPYWLQTTIVPMKDAEGKPWQFVGIGTDITERKRIEAGLRRSEHWARELIEALPAAVYTTDAKGMITMFNRTAVEFSGRVPRLGSDSWCVSWKLYNSDGTPLPHDQCPMAVALRTGHPVRDCEAIAERPDGTRVNFIPYPTPLRDASGVVIGAVNMLVDITVRKQDEEALRLLGSAVQQAQESIIITDADLNLPGPHIRFVNAAFTTMTGYTSADVLGKTPRISQGPRTDRAVIKRLRDTLAAGGTFQGETVNYRKDGSAYDLEWQVAPIRNSQGVTTHYVAVQRDISARKAIEAELERARESALESARLKSQFLANMSHELRTPLNTINGLSATLVEQDIPKHVRQAAGMILQCGESLLENIQTILTHSSLEAGKTQLEAKPFSVVGLMLGALRITAEAAQRKRIDLDFDLDPRLPSELIGDPFRLQQILVNLLANAIKFTDAGRVCLRMRSRPLTDGGHQLRISVADTGIGISPETLTKLFKPFAQADDSTTRRHEGTGLGLVITKSLVELMGGHITVRTRTGVGSIFSFEVNLSAVANTCSLFTPFARRELLGKRLFISDPMHARRCHLAVMAKALGMEVSYVPDELCDLAILRAPTAPAETLGEGWPQLSSVPTLWICPFGWVQPSAEGNQTAVVCTPFGPSELSEALVSLLQCIINTRHSSALTQVSPLTLGERLPLRILGADDMHTNCEVMKVICKHLGYQIDVVSNGSEVLSRLDDAVYDLVLLDVQMPVLDGIATAKEIHHRYPDALRRPKIVAITASAQPGDREHCLEAGMDDYISKPIQPKHLHACIQRLFDLKKAPLVRDIADYVPQPVAKPAWVDDSHLLSITAGLDEETAHTLLEQLYEATKADYQALRPRVIAACASRENKTLHACVHGLKGCALNLGWSRLGAHCVDTLALLHKNRFADWADFPVRLDQWFQVSAAAYEKLLLTRFGSVATEHTSAKPLASV